MVKLKLSKRGIIFVAIAIIVVILLMVLGLRVLSNASVKTPVELTESFMKKYQIADSEIMNKIEYPFDDQLTDEQLKRYKDLIETQYLALDYQIVEENIGELDAIIKVEFSVFDYASSYDKATNYLNVYEKDMSSIKQVDYKLKEMENTQEKITYAITFNYYKLDGKWIMLEVSDTDLSKLSGTY